MYQNELRHYGVKGMKWGVRRARKENAKVDKSFQSWKEGAQKRDTAISLGKSANTARIAYQKDRKNKDLKKEYKSANKDYKKALRQNTTYRKGTVKQEVGKDASRKYLSEAKKIKKQLEVDPNNRALKKKYKQYSDEHEVQRAKARKAQSVGEKRSRRKAAFKRSMTMSVKAAATTAAVTAGTYAVNKYLNDHEVTFNGKSVNLGAQSVRDAVETAKKVSKFMEFMY